MKNRKTLNQLAEILIHKSTSAFSSEEFAKILEGQWQKEVSGSAMKRLKKVLINHPSLVGIQNNNFIPFSAVVKKIGHVSLSVQLGAWELKQGVLIPGHRLIPFMQASRKESELTFQDQNGNEIPKLKKSYFIQDIAPFYQYCGGRHFPEEIKINEWIPGKSCMAVTVWDMQSLYKSCSSRPGDSVVIDLID